MKGLLRKKIDISFLKKIDTRFGDSALWQFVKFNLVSFSITLLQLALANLLPLIFDGLTAKLQPVLRPVFRPEKLFEGHSPYVVDGVVTWGYVLPFFLSNFIANLYGYFMNMKTTFRGKGSRSGLVTYLMILSLLILFSTWLQGWITARLSATTFAALGRTIAASAAGLVQVAVLFPLEKYVLFKKELKMEKVSVIVPVYNGEKSIKRCSDSILNQDYPELELILVDDGSRDCSWEIMQALAAADHRVKAIHQENGGVSSARNRALAEASGTFVQFADVDDWLPMDATKLLVREMEAQSSELVVGDFYRVVDGNVSEKGSIASGGTLTLQQYADEMMLSPADLYYGVLWNKLYRRDIIERYGIRMDENISYSEDMIFNLEYLLHVKNIAILKAPVYYYQYTKGSLVDQSLNLSSTIKMKKNVIGYYNEFFKKTFDAPAYQERLPVIYGYLLAVSHDSLALPFTPGTRKLTAGSDLSALSGESGTAFPMRSAILETRLLGRYLETLGRKHGMDEARIKILYCMEKRKEPCSIESLCLLTGMGKPTVIVAMARLLADGLVRREASLGGEEHFSFQAPELTEELQQLDWDVDAVCFAGFTEEELRQYRELEERIGNRILHHLQAETAKES